MKNYLFASLTVLLCVSAASGAPTVVVGNHDLLPNTPGQSINIPVTGAVGVEGLNAYVQIGDTTAGPVISNITDPNFGAMGVDLETGTIFAGNNFGQLTSLTQNRLWILDIITASGSAATSGTLMTITLDTTGLTTGTFDLLLAGTNGGDTEFLDSLGGLIQASITNGTVTVIPEPMTLTLLGIPVIAGLLRRRKRTC